MPQDPFAAAASAGIHRIAIPTPFAVGRVNVYLIEDEPLTLVDAGPNSGSSLDELERSSRRSGTRSRTSSWSILTHQHIDHLGLVGIVAARSGAEVAAIDAAVPFVENYGEEAAADDEFAAELMLRHGIPEDVVSALQAVSRAFRAWGARGDVTRVLHDGETIELRDRTLRGPATGPGHSPTDTIFLDAERRTCCRGRSPARAHLLQPADLAAARRTASARRRWSRTSSRCSKTREMDLDARAARATATRSTTTAR